MRDYWFELYGFMAIFIIAGIGVLVLGKAVADPAVIQSLADISPWLAHNARVLSWVTIGVVMVTALALPPVLMSRDSHDGGSRLEKIGFVVWSAALLPSVGFLLGVGWFGAGRVMG